MPIIRDGTVCGTAELVAGAAEADLFLLAEDGVILAVDADSKAVEQRHRIMLDGSVTADLSFTTKGADFELLGQDEESALLVERANDMVLSARCAEAVGLMRRMMADSITYLGQRRQFGRQIASFQALRHRAADMQLALMKAGALTEAAIREFESDKDTNRGALVSAACIEVSDAARRRRRSTVSWRDGSDRGIGSRTLFQARPCDRSGFGTQGRPPCSLCRICPIISPANHGRPDHAGFRSTQRRCSPHAH